jgi:hypothetical protein
MPPMAGVVITVIVIIVGLFLLKPLLSKMGQAKGYEVAHEQIRGEIVGRLEAIASQVGGTIVEGPALQTPQGRLTLVASAAPKSLAIDVVKFTAALGVKAQLTLLPVQDEAKALVTKNLHPVTPEDPAVAAEYKLLASDDAFGRKVAAPPLIGRMKELDQAVGGRSRLQIAPSGATVLVARTLSRPEELKAFYDRSVAVIECLKTLAGNG